MESRPKINDQYWFDLSEKIINNSIPNLDKGIVKVNTYIISLWVIYTAASLFTIDYVDLNDNQYYVYIIIPHFILLLGRWFTVHAQLPISIKFLPESPTEIQDAYRKTYRYKKVYLVIANILSLIATIFIIFILTFSFLENNRLNKNKALVENRKIPNLNINYLKRKKTLIIKGEIIPNTNAKITTWILSNTNDTLFTEVRNIISSSEGILNIEKTIGVEKKGELFCELTWINESEQVTKKLIKNIRNFNTDNHEK